MSRISAVQKYLNHYAEQEVEVVDALKEITKGKQYEHVLVIPCFDETTDFAQRLLKSDLWKQNILVIVVINQSVDSGINTNNKTLWQFFKALTFCSELPNTLLCGNSEDNSKFLVIDRFRDKKIPKKEGVGLARKIGCDIACRLISDSVVTHPWIHTTDADALLPSTYFKASQDASPAASAIIYNFEHVRPEDCAEQVYKATMLYESSLRYYYRGLLWAGSPYAFYTIGSTLAVHWEAYAQCRGFPKRAGAEDFYLLNKLAKVGNIQFIEPTRVKIFARISQRAPFGTGQAVQSIIQQEEQGQEFNYYAPECFALLKQWLNARNQLWHALCSDSNINSYNEYQALIAEQTLSRILTELNFYEFENHVRRQVRNVKQFERVFHDWFDAFKTLKFIRLSQQYFYPAKPFNTCQNEAPF